MTYKSEQKVRATAWKKLTSALPSAARDAAPYLDQEGVPTKVVYDHCLPLGYASHNLLPEVRANSLTLFETLGIPWHAGVGDGPTNNLVSSQVQCVNALAQMVTDPDRLVRAFGPVVKIGEVLQVEAGRFLTFEYNGPEDFFGEVPPGVKRIRGSLCTRVDAAFLHVASDGVVELVLVEWKFTESYSRRDPEPEKDKTRERRYRRAVEDPKGPINGDVLDFEYLLDEPFYQLVRQQLLAFELQKIHVEGAERVRVVHVAPTANTAYQRSLVRPEHRAIGSSVSDVWGRLLDHKDAFTSMDSAVFLDPKITSREYLLRYGADVVHDSAELLATLGLDHLGDLEDWLATEHEFEGYAVTTDKSVELVVDRTGTALEYPFSITELSELAEELWRG